MKKMKMLLAVLLLLVSTMANESVAQAAEDRMVIVPVGNRTIEELSQSDMMEIQQEIFQEASNEEVSFPLTSNTSYEPYRYTDAFDFYLDGTWVARADVECIVWHYTDGKVHLYQRTITVRRLTTYDAARVYGRIVNTDGSLSYTTGDRVHLYGLTNTWDFAIDFRVTPTEASFNCYEV